MTDYDRDPEALAWARVKVQEVVGKAEACAANMQLSDEAREGWRQTALFIRHELVRRDGAAYASFDERWPRLVNSERTATEATELETTARVFAGLHRSAEQDVTRVIELYERWVKEGAPPLGVPIARWWDKRLVELHDAIRPADGAESQS